MIFKSTELCKHHHNPILEYFHHPKRPFVPIVIFNFVTISNLQKCTKIIRNSYLFIYYSDPIVFIFPHLLHHIL